MLFTLREIKWLNPTYVDYFNSSTFENAVCHVINFASLSNTHNMTLTMFTERIFIVVTGNQVSFANIENG